MNVQPQAPSTAELFASAGHDLRTPLNAIIGFAELLEDGTGGPLSDRQARYVHHILTSGRALLALIDQILDMTPERGAAPRDPGVECKRPATAAPPIAAGGGQTHG